MMVAAKTEDYELLGDVLDEGLKELGYSKEDPSAELFTSNKQHVLDLYCSKGCNSPINFTSPRSGWPTGSPRLVNWESADQNGPETFPYGYVLPQLGNPWGK